jgi:hypothetical protein
MAAFIMEQFGGIAPKQDPRRLAPPLAQEAQNCLLSAGALEPLPGMAATADTVAANAISLYRYNNSWLAYTNDRNFAKVPIANDVLDRLVITNPAAYPVIYSAGTSYRLGLPRPVGSPSAVATTEPEDPNGLDAETVSYVVTLVDAWGAEGPPSLPSPSIDRVRDTEVTITLPDAPSGNFNFGSGALKRIYRSNTGTSGSSYQYVAEVAVSANQYVDNVPNGNLGEVLPSVTWVGPPDDDSALYPNGPMVGVTALPNGLLAGFADTTLCFSEPYLYHAWPFEYRITFAEKIVGIASIAAGLLVVTRRTAYLVAGVSPAAMTVTRLEINQACVSKRGLVDMGDYAIYPSPDGLVAVSGNRAELLTKDIFTREQWQQLVPTTISAYEHEGRYIAFYNDGAPKGFIFDPSGGLNSFVPISANISAAHYDAFTDTLFVNNNGTIRRWEQDFVNVLPYTWKSRKYVAEKPVCFSLVRVQAWDNLTSKPITVKVWADGSLKTTVTLNGTVPYARLPSGFVAKVWEVEFTGSNPISHAGLFTSFVEAV